MPKSQFSEDEYEDFLIDDLRVRQGPHRAHYKPTRVLEHYIGFDFGVDTYFPALRGSGVWLASYVGAFMPAQLNAVLPIRWLSSFIQCKVPYRVTQRHTATSYQWTKWGSPYFRFDAPDEPQKTALMALERCTKGAAIVRYAAPCFHTYLELETADATGTVAQRSHYQSPARLAKHTVYTFQNPIQPGVGFSEPERLDPQYLLAELRAGLYDGPDSTLAHHVATLFQALRGDEALRIELTEADIRSAVTTFGERVESPLDPMGVMSDDPFATLEIRGHREGHPTVMELAALIFALSRIVRTTGSTDWRLHADPFALGTPFRKRSP